MSLNRKGLFAALALACLSVLHPTVAAAQSARSGSTSAAASADAKDRQIQELQAHVKRLEARLAELERKVAPMLARQGGGGGGAEGAAEPAAQNAQALLQKNQIKARERMRADLKKHKQDELRKAEELYQVANKNWRSEEAKQSLQQMVEQFPDINRTGCAVLYLGQYATGEERERLLTDAAEKYGDCYYGNGVQVGAYARFLLGLYYQENSQADKAKKLFDEIRTKYADATDHRGRSLVAQIPGPSTP
jgi:TolA-binding protein